MLKMKEIPVIIIAVIVMGVGVSLLAGWTAIFYSTLAILGIVLIISSPFVCKFTCFESGCVPYNLKCFILFFGSGLIFGVIGFILNIKKEYKKKRLSQMSR